MFNKAGKFSGGFTKVYKPSITSPTANQIIASRTPTITSSSFSKYGNITHTSTDWQVSDASDFNTIRWSSSDDTSNKTSITTSDLAGGDRYVRVRYKASSGVYSDWSDAVLFTSPWATGSNATLTSPTNMDVNASTTVTLQSGTYRISLWGAGGGGANGGGRGGGSGGGSGSVYKDVLYSTQTNVAFSIGSGGGGSTYGSGAGGSGGSPGGGSGLNPGSAFWNGAGGGGYSNSSTLSMTAAGGGGAGGDNGSTGAGGAGGSGSGGAGYELINISSSASKSGGFTIPGNNFSQDTGCSVSGTYNCSFSFSNMQGKQITVTLTASGSSGSQSQTFSCCSGSGSLSLSFNGDYRNISVDYAWCGSGASGISHNLSISWSGVGQGSSATAGSSGGGGGGGGCVSNGAGSIGGSGGSNSGSYTSSFSGSGSDAGNRYYSSTYSRYFGDGGAAGSSGQNGGARIQKISTQLTPVVSITSNLASTSSSTAGSSSNFSITATDTANNDSTVSYQWYLSTDGGSSYSTISGATSNTLTRYSPFYYSDNGHKIKCRATVTNTAGTNYVDSNVCTLTVARNYDCNSSTVTGTQSFGSGLRPSTNGSGDEQWSEWSPGHSDICSIDGNLSSFNAKGRFCNWNMELELRITKSTDGTRKHWGSQSKSGSAGSDQTFDNVKANGGGWDPENDGTPTYRLMVIDSGTQCQSGSQDIGCESGSITLNYSYKRRTYYYETRP